VSDHVQSICDVSWNFAEPSSDGWDMLSADMLRDGGSRLMLVKLDVSLVLLLNPYSITSWCACQPQVKT
jgi:hypothetical protein